MIDLSSLGGDLRLEEIQRGMQRAGLTLAKVTNITDPEKLNRVMCRPVAAESEKDILETEWCPVVQPLSGSGRGQFFMPSVDDLVVLGYLNGDPHCPYVLGGTWNNESAAAYKVEDGKNLNFSIKTPSGTEILLYDEPEKESVVLRLPTGACLEINEGTKSASLKDGEGKNQLSINWEKGEITLSAEQKLTLSAGSTELVLDASGTLSMSADKSVTMTGADISAEASNGLTAKGTSSTVEATGKLTLKGSTAELQGPMGVNIN